MNPDEYQRLAARTECNQARAAERFGDYDGKYPSLPMMATRLNHAVIGMAGEVGELAASVEHVLYYGQDMDLANVAEELGDLLWYLAGALNAVDLTFSQVMKANIAKLQKRYPEKYSDILALEENRDRGTERRIVEEAVEELR